MFLLHRTKVTKATFFYAHFVLEFVTCFCIFPFCASFLIVQLWFILKNSWLLQFPLCPSFATVSTIFSAQNSLHNLGYIGYVLLFPHYSRVSHLFLHFSFVHPILNRSTGSKVSAFAASTDLQTQIYLQTQLDYECNHNTNPTHCHLCFTSAFLNVLLDYLISRQLGSNAGALSVCWAINALNGNRLYNFTLRFIL